MRTTKIQDELERSFIPHLKTQFSQALPVLLTGAGFSLGARNHDGRTLPSYENLRAELWNLCFPDVDFDGSSLQTLYDYALIRHRRKTEQLLRRLLTVDPATLPDWYELVFSLPWHRCYTLNIDDLANAANTAFKLPRKLTPTSATQPTPKAITDPRTLEVVHLNGTLEDLPSNVTFSLTQFAERLAKPEPFYVNFVAELLSRPVVIIGTRLDEPPLWQHIEYRRQRGGKDLDELRPRSYLVTPTLDLTRKALLAELNIRWIQMSGEEFVSQVLSRFQEEARVGLKRFSKPRDARSTSISLVADIAIKPDEESQFLLGQEPIWADLQSGRAVGRSIDDKLWTTIKSSLNKEKGKLIVLTGTAGSGKSTSLMRACLRLQGEGNPVGWIDRDNNPSTWDIMSKMREEKSPRVLAIDDADMYGANLLSLVRNLVCSPLQKIVLIAVRSSRVDNVLNPVGLEKISEQEFTMPTLTDADIDKLIEVLDKNNRLGFLKGKKLHEQRELFRQKAGRQLLVAMIEVTSNRRFEEKAVNELTDLDSTAAKIYAQISVAHSFRFGLQQEEILLAAPQDLSNEVLNAIKRLVSRKIVSYRSTGFIWARHRYIADILHNKLQETGHIRDVLDGLTFLAASKVRLGMRRASRPRRMIRALLNHEYLLRVIGIEPARNLYASLESLLHWDYHYWLQRGSAEVEAGDISLAEQFLNQARSISPDDPFVQNEWAYFLFRRAVTQPGSAEAPSLVREATEILERLMQMGEYMGAYPYHVLGSQGLAWSRRAMGLKKKEHYLQSLLTTLKQGIRRYPRNKELGQLYQDLTKEYLQTALG